MTIEKIIKFTGLIILRTFQRLLPKYQVETPASFIFYFGAIFMTGCSLYSWENDIFNALFFKFAMNLWILVFFMQFCNAAVEIRKRGKNID